MRLSMKMFAVAALGLALTAGPALAQTPGTTKPTLGQTPGTAKPPAPETQKPAAPAAPATQKPAEPATPAPAPRPFPEGAKIAYIDLQYIASNSAEGKTATAKIQEYAKKKTAELEGKQKALEAARNKLLQGGTVLSENARGQMEKEIDKMARELQFAQQEAQSEQQALTTELQNDFQTRLNPIIDQVANEKGLHYVLSIADSGVVWVNTGLNISAEVMKRLDAAAKTK
jgi:Skp family chaperone for outer membrane proteins